MSLLLRPGRPCDVAAMVALRAQLFTDLAAQGSATRPHHATETTWRGACAAIITTQLTHPDHHYSVATTHDGHVLGWGHAIMIHQLPGPGFPAGLMGQISSVVTDPTARGQGIGTAVSADLLRWLTAAGAEVVDLLASHDSTAMYRRLGFREPSSTALRYLRPSTTGS